MLTTRSLRIALALLAGAALSAAGCSGNSLFRDGPTSGSGAAAQGGGGSGGGGQGGTAGSCGDTIRDQGEECDGSDLGGASCLDLGFASPGTLGCTASCTFDTSACESSCDGLQLEPNEACDGDDLGGQTCVDFGFSAPAGLGCTLTCEVDTSGCTTSCDGGLLEPGEACDGADLDNASCTDFGFVNAAGLACDASCQFDDSGCMAVCGNTIVEPGEACDDGNDFPGDGCDNCQQGGATCATALPVALGLGTVLQLGTTVAGGQHAASGCQGEQNSPDRVYAVTPSQNGFLTAVLPRATTDYDSILYVLTDCNNPNSALWCVDNYDDQQARLNGGETLSVPVQAGTTYFVVVDGFDGSSGSYELSLDLSLGTCADPIPFPVWGAQDLSGLGSTQGAASTQGTLACGGNASAEIVYELQPQFSGNMQVRLPSADVNYDSVLSVRSDCTSVLSEVMCEHNSNGQESFTVATTMGQSLYALVDGWFGGVGEYRLRVGAQ